MAATGIERRLVKVEARQTAARRCDARQYQDLPLDEPERIQRIVGILSGAAGAGDSEPMGDDSPEVQERVNRILECLEAGGGAA